MYHSESRLDPHTTWALLAKPPDAEAIKHIPSETVQALVFPSPPSRIFNPTCRSLTITHHLCKSCCPSHSSTRAHTIPGR